MWLGKSRKTEGFHLGNRPPKEFVSLAIVWHVWQDRPPFTPSLPALLLFYLAVLSRRNCSASRPASSLPARSFRGISLNRVFFSSDSAKTHIHVCHLRSSFSFLLRKTVITLERSHLPECSKSGFNSDPVHRWQRFSITRALQKHTTMDGDNTAGGKGTGMDGRRKRKDNNCHVQPRLTYSSTSEQAFDSKTLFRVPSVRQRRPQNSIGADAQF